MMRSPLATLIQVFADLWPDLSRCRLYTVQCTCQWNVKPSPLQSPVQSHGRISISLDSTCTGGSWTKEQEIERKRYFFCLHLGDIWVVGSPGKFIKCREASISLMEKIHFVDSVSLLRDIITCSVMSWIITKYCGRDVSWRQGKEAYRKSPIWYIDNFCVCEIISKNLYTREGTVISKALALKNLRWQFASERNWTQQKCLLLGSGLCYPCHERAIFPWLCSQWISKYIKQGSKPQKTRALKTVVVICPEGEIQTIIHRDSDDFRYLDCQPAVNLLSLLELFLKINRGCQFDVPAYFQNMKPLNPRRFSEFFWEMYQNWLVWMKYGMSRQPRLSHTL